MMSIKQTLLVCLIFVTPCCNGSSINCTEEETKPQALCSIRYDIATVYGDEIYTNMTCGKWYGYKPICDEELKIQHYNIPPYMFVSSDGSVDGILPALLNLTMKQCCYMCTRIIYMKPFKTIKESTKWFYNSSAYSIMMPALAVSTAETYFAKPFVKLVNTPGVIYVTIDKSEERSMEKMLESIGSTWPIFVIVSLLTLEGGIIIWLLDQQENPEEFPKSFFQGFLEGSWWSYVSITTVGYGDKTPRSLQGRIFAVLWITIGIAITGIFTASLSSSLTSAAIPGKTSLKGLRVGYLLHVVMAYEENIIYREGGKPKAFLNVKEMIESLKNGEIAGILSDAFVLDYHWNDFKKSGLTFERKTDIKNSDTCLGMMFSGPKLKPWATFINSFMVENKDAESRLLTKAIDGMKEKFTRNMIDDTSGPIVMYKSYRSIITVMGICCGVSIFTGILFELLRKYYYSRKDRKVVKDHEMETKNDHKNLDEKFQQLSTRIELLQVTVSELRAEISKKHLDV